MTHQLPFTLMIGGVIAASLCGAVLAFAPYIRAGDRWRLSPEPAALERWDTWAFLGLTLAAGCAFVGAFALGATQRRHAWELAALAQRPVVVDPHAPVAFVDALPQNAEHSAAEGRPLPAGAQERPAPERVAAQENPMPQRVRFQSDEISRRHAEVERVLEQWASAMQSNDPAREASFYADRMDRYFLRQNVSHDFVLADKERFVLRGRRLRAFDVQNLALEDESPTAVKARFLKHWLLAQADAPESLSEHTSRSWVEVRRINGAWKITGEQDLRSDNLRPSALRKD